jgi:hypothetical protein
VSVGQGVSTPVSVGAQPTPPATSTNVRQRRRTTPAPGVLVHLSARELAVVEVVAQVGQMSARQIADVCFAGLKSATPCKRTLQRLTQRGMLARLELRIVGGSGGGSSQYVYQLGRQGGKRLRLAKEYPRYGEYRPHMVAVGECFARLKRLEHAGLLTVLGYEGEEAAYSEVFDARAHRTIKLTPDLWLDIGVHQPRRRLEWWLEVDTGSEHNEHQIPEKLQRYGRAHEAWDADVHGEVFPRVVFVVPDEKRQRRIERDISRQPQPWRKLFRVCLVESFPQSLLTEIESIDFRGHKLIIESAIINRSPVCGEAPRDFDYPN